MNDAEELASDIEWVKSLPPHGRSAYDWEAIAAQLRRRPMKWGRIFVEDKASIPNAVRQGSVAAVHPNLGFEVTTKNNVRTPTRTCSMFMRYNPDKVVK